MIDIMLQFETLRICPAVPYIPKSTTPEPQTIALPSPGADPTRREYIIPPNTLMYINVPALHNSPKYWGSDTSTFRPSRWIHTDSSPPDSNTSEPVASFDSESFKTFLPGQFIPWAAGPRSCPGMKFAQVEAVSVLATVFRRARVRPTLAPNLRTGPMDLSDGKLAWRLAKAVMDEKRVEVTLTMQRPKDLWLKWRMAE